MLHLTTTKRLKYKAARRHLCDFYRAWFKQQSFRSHWH